jgi:DNA-binding beta-propeller fold protein YncE
MKIFKLSLIAVVFLAAPWAAVLAQNPEPIQIEAKIELGNVMGRIDHMAIDLGRQRLFVAELGNNSLGVVDLKDRKLLRRINELSEPQGVTYVVSGDMLYVANAGDGSVRLFRAEDFAAAGRIDLGDDADNIRVEPRTNRVFVGYGSGALAVIDPASRSKLFDISLKAHPESFQLDSSTGLIFINVPKTGEIDIADRVAGKQIGSWPTNNDSNFPMAIDESAQRILVVFRRTAARVETCRDADDVFLDSKRRRVYVSCGEGFVDVFDARADYRRFAHIPTVSGARTSLFVPELDRLFLAARESSGEPAAIWILRPSP